MTTRSIEVLAPYQQRVVDELADLNERRRLLSKFILSDTFTKVPNIERILLTEQQDAMTMYSTVLTNRIHYFSEPS